MRSRGWLAGWVLALAGSVHAQTAYIPVRIAEIQYTEDPAGGSPLEGARVTFTGVVTAGPDVWQFGLTGFFVQDEEAPWSGIYVYTGNFTGTLPPLDIGDSVQVWGTVTEYNGVTEISPLDSVRVLARRVRMPRPLPVRAGWVCTGCDSAEAYEGVLVQVDEAVVVNPNLGFGEWMISDGGPGDTVRVDDAAGYAYTPASGDSLLAVVGVLHYAYGASKIEPRGDGDLFLQDPAGSGVWSGTPLLGFVGDTMVMRLRLVGTVRDTLRAFRVFFPSGGTIVESRNPQGVFQGAQVSVGGSVLDVSGFAMLQGDTGSLEVRWVVPPEGTYLLTAQTAKTTFGNLVPLGFTSVSLRDYLAGSGDAWVVPTRTHIQTPTDLEIAWHLELPVDPPRGVRQVRVEVVGDAVWSGSFQTGGAFEGAQVTVQSTDSSILLDLQGFEARAGDTGRVLLLGYTPQGAAGSRRIWVSSGLDSLALLEDMPLYLAVEPDTSGVIPLGLLHDPVLSPLLEGLSLRVRGTVTAVFSDKVFLQDATGGVVLYRPEGVFQVGDSVEVRGVFSPYYGLAELTPAQLVQTLAQGRAVVPETLDLAQVGEPVEGRLVAVRGVWVAGGQSGFVVEGGRYDTTTNAVVIQDRSGQRLWLYAERGSGLAGVTLPPDTFHVVGVVQQDSRAGVFQYVITPRGVEDLTLTGRGAGRFTLSWPFFTGDPVETLWLRMESPVPLGQVVIRFPAESLQVDRVVYPGGIQVDTVAGWVQWALSPGTMRDSIRMEGVRLRASRVTLQVSTAPDVAASPAPVLRSPQMVRTEALAAIQEPGPDGDTSLRVGDTVVVGGVVVGPSRVFSPEGRTSFYLQDRTAGINVFAGFPVQPVESGELLFLRGVVTEYQGLTEVVLLSDTALHRLGMGVPPDPRPLSPGEGLRESLEGMLVRVDTGVVAQAPYLSGNGYTLPLWNGAALVTVYAYNTTGLDTLMQRLRKGDRIRVVGVVGQYQTTYQLLPRGPEDVVLLGVNASPELSFRVSPNVVALFRGECLTLEVSGPASAEYTVEVYDLAGRLRATPVRRRVGGFALCWDGRGRDGRRLSGGLHVAKLVVRHPDGRLEEVLRPFVVGVN